MLEQLLSGAQNRQDRLNFDYDDGIVVVEVKKGKTRCLQQGIPSY
jgi:hypothetical protein